MCSGLEGEELLGTGSVCERARRIILRLKILGLYAVKIMAMYFFRV
jgi:hypothetical protein